MFFAVSKQNHTLLNTYVLYNKIILVYQNVSDYRSLIISNI